MYCIIQTTYTHRNIGEAIINALFEKNLAACIQKQTISSRYKWNGQVEHENETLLLIKTKEVLFEEIKDLILELHDSATPEIIMVPIISGSQEYLDWIDEVTCAT
ncbi:MAG: divalent-cation tolerance protein CutA [Sulfurovaceae bacterium]|jgi:periplasmic divalent cation tolerance protein